MNSKTPYILAAILLIIAFLIYNNRNKNLQLEIENTTAIATKASDLYTAYENNEQLGDSLYKNKLLEVTGNIVEISKNNEGEYEVLLETNSELGYVACKVENSSPNQNLLVENKLIKLKGVCSGLMMDVILINCTIVK
jgi:tRNA_anti-like